MYLTIFLDLMFKGIYHGKQAHVGKSNRIEFFWCLVIIGESVNIHHLLWHSVWGGFHRIL